MKLWNSHIHTFPPYGDRLLLLVCQRFVQRFANVIVNKNLRHNILLHFMHLWDVSELSILVCMYHVCMYVCMYACTGRLLRCVQGLNKCMYVCMYACIHIYHQDLNKFMYVCMVKFVLNRWVNLNVNVLWFIDINLCYLVYYLVRTVA